MSTSITIPVTDADPIKVSGRSGRGIALHQRGHRIILSNNDILAVVDAIVETAQRNREASAP